MKSVPFPPSIFYLSAPEFAELASPARAVVFELLKRKQSNKENQFVEASVFPTSHVYLS